jgi:hypothetical protein
MRYHVFLKEPLSMKNVLVTLLQFILFLAVFAVGSFVPPLHLEQVLKTTPDGIHIFIWDGLAMMFVLFLVILLIESLRKRIAAAGRFTAAAFALALIAGYALKFGFLTR